MTIEYRNFSIGLPVKNKCGNYNIKIKNLDSNAYKKSVDLTVYSIEGYIEHAEKAIDDLMDGE